MMNGKGNKSRRSRWLSGMTLLAILMILVFAIGFHQQTKQVAGIWMLMGYAGILLLLSTLYVLLVRRGRVVLSWVVLLPALLLSLEIACSVLLGLPEYSKPGFKAPNRRTEHLARHIGSVPPPDTVVRRVKVEGADTLNDVKYTTDVWSKRVTPFHDTTRSRYALFFGCSITFGLHVNDQETMPWFFQEGAKDYNVYNYAVTGHGANHMLARMQHSSLKEQVAEDSGVAFYVFFSDHIYRTIGSMNRYTAWLVNAPYYYLDGDVLKRDRMFVDGRLWLSKFYQIASRSSIVQYFGIDFPLRIRNRHLRLVAEVILEAKREYTRQFGNDRFFVVLYPELNSADQGLADRLSIMLKDRGVEIIDISEGGFSHEMSLGWDGHPSSETHQFMANRLLETFVLIQNLGLTDRPTPLLFEENVGD
jgi:hypothetical protein